ncbi:hypothetical protein [Verrucomicrobium sp. BvORR106]|uniref:hypothetical protein n=1 Tax=Verrucomicrobium sp. BvORR106 TaxID=1403819 RepID=UPI002240EA60|nr:hypothetical protein [Verrucomicrobium sp. BvORR106]
MIRTVLGLDVPDVQHLGNEIILSLSPEHLTMFRERAKAAGKGSVAEYFAEDSHNAPVPYEIVGTPTAPPAPSTVCPYMASLIAAFPANRRKAILKRAQKAVEVVGMPFTDLLRNVVSKALQEIDATGSFLFRGWSPDIVFTKLRIRLAEVDRVFGLQGEDGFTQGIMASVMRDLLNGEDGLLMESYNFDNPKQAHRDYVAMVGRWRKEDGLPPLKLPPRHAQRTQKTERRAA